MSVKDYNVEPELNVSISGISIAEGCAPSGINDALRQLMADVKEESEAQAQAVGEAASEASTQLSSLDSTLRAFIAEEVAKYLPLAGGTMGGSIMFAPAEQDGLNAIRAASHSQGYLQFCGGIGYSSGATLALYGIEHGSNHGAFMLNAQSAEKNSLFEGRPDGTLTWAGNAILTSAGGSLAGRLKFTKNPAHYIEVDANGDLLIGGNGSLFRLRGLNSDANPGGFQLRANDGSKNRYLIAEGEALEWNGASVYTSSGGLLMNSTNVKIYSTASVTLPSGGTWAVIGHSSGDGHDANIRGTYAGGTKVSMTDYGGAKFILALKIAA